MREFRGKLLVEALVTVPLVLPPTVLGFYLLVDLRRALAARRRRFRPGRANRWRSLSRGCCSRRPSPIFRLSSSRFSAASKAIPADVRDAAACCGLTPWQRFVRIEVPLAWPGILTAAILDLRPHARRVRRRADGGRQSSGRDANAERRDLRSHERVRRSERRRDGRDAAGHGGVDADGSRRRCRAGSCRAVADRGALGHPSSERPDSARCRVHVRCRATCSRFSGRPAAARRRSCAASPACTGPRHASVRSGADVWTDTAAGFFAPPHRRAVGFVFQEYALFPHLTAAGNVITALGHRPRAERRARAEQLLALVHLSGHLNRRPQRTVGRRAPARGAGPRAGARAGGAAAGRAVRGGRPHRPQAPAGRDRRAAPDARHPADPRHPRFRRRRAAGDAPVDPGAGHEPSRAVRCRR